MSSSRAKQNRPDRRLTAVYRRGFEDGRRAALSAAEPVGWQWRHPRATGGEWMNCPNGPRADKLSEAEYRPVYAAPRAPSVAVKALLDDVWNAAVERAAVIANDSVHLTPDPGAAIKTMLNGRATLHPPSEAALSAQVQDVADSPAIKAIAAERRRQIEKEGWSPDHDDAHCDGSIALAGACYAMFAAVSDNARRSTQLPGSLTNDGQAVEGWAAFLSIWPWERHFWKPTTRVRDLEKAGALIAAELDRVIRAAAPAKQEGGQ